MGWAKAAEGAVWDALEKAHHNVLVESLGTTHPTKAHTYITCICAITP